LSKIILPTCALVRQHKHFYFVYSLNASSHLFHSHRVALSDPAAHAVVPPGDVHRASGVPSRADTSLSVRVPFRRHLVCLGSNRGRIRSIRVVNGP
jgi:hypothetical protein